MSSTGSFTGSDLEAKEFWFETAGLKCRTVLEPKRKIHLVDIKSVDWIDLWDVLAAAAGA